jgi:D,D-heptose 1,7-bisphosphate phosphatase
MTKALFLDRDGIVNVDRGYVSRSADFVFVEGIFELCALAQQKGYLIIVVTNQSGIERGYFTEADFHRLSDYMRGEFKTRGIDLAEVYYCPYLDHEDRKPNPGMFLRAQEKYDIDMARSVALGDKERDIEAALRAKVGTAVLLSEGAAAQRATAVVKSLAEVREFL